MARRATLSVLVLLVLAGPRLAPAKAPPYDFTGSWVGAILAAGHQEDLTATLASSGRRIAGSVVAEGALGTVSCSVHGRQGRKVVLRLACEDGTHAKLKGVLDATTGTLAGSARLSKRGRSAAGTFALGKPAA